MKRFALIALLAFTGCAPKQTTVAPIAAPTIAPVAVPTVAPPVAVAPVVTVPVVTPPVVPPIAPVVPSQSVLISNREIAYTNHFVRVFELIGKAHQSLKAENGLSLMEADINAAWQLQMSNFNEPPVFAVTDSYLTSTLQKYRAALRGVQFKRSSAIDDFDAASALLDETKIQFDKASEQIKQRRP